MTIGAGRLINCATNDVLTFQIVGTKDSPGVVWLYAPASVGLDIGEVSYERLPGSGPFRMELHKGRLEPVGPATPQVRTLHTTFLSDTGEWATTGGWQQGAGVHSPASLVGDVGDAGSFQYFTFLLYPQRGSAGAGVRCFVTEEAPT